MKISGALLGESMFRLSVRDRPLLPALGDQIPELATALEHSLIFIEADDQSERFLRCGSGNPLLLGIGGNLSRSVSAISTLFTECTPSSCGLLQPYLSHLQHNLWVESEHETP